MFNSEESYVSLATATHVLNVYECNNVCLIVYNYCTYCLS